MSEVTGDRRIYIHREALRDVALQGETQARATSQVLAEVRFAKIAHHHIVENGVEMGAVCSAVADLALPSTVGLRQGSITEFLRGLTYIPKLPWRDAARLPVLLPDEVVESTCSQDGFYTFATGPEAAKRMFEDRVPMPKLKQSIADGRGPEDLTIITRKGRLAIASLAVSGAVDSPIDLARVREVDAMLLDEVGQGATALAEAAHAGAGDLTELETQIMQGFVGAVQRTFEAPSY